LITTDKKNLDSKKKATRHIMAVTACTAIGQSCSN